MKVRALLHHALDAGRINLAVRAGHEQHFGAVGKEFRRAAFVSLNVGGLVTEDAVIRLAHGSE
jgi:hypothetical protein